MLENLVYLVTGVCYGGVVTWVVLSFRRDLHYIKTNQDDTYGISELARKAKMETWDYSKFKRRLLIELTVYIIFLTVVFVLPVKFFTFLVWTAGKFLGV